MTRVCALVAFLLLSLGIVSDEVQIQDPGVLPAMIELSRLAGSTSEKAGNRDCIKDKNG